MEQKMYHAIGVSAFFEKGVLVNVWDVTEKIGKKVVAHYVEVIISSMPGEKIFKMSVSAWKKSKWHKGLL